MWLGLAFVHLSALECGSNARNRQRPTGVSG
jgi:hypothetical protein